MNKKILEALVKAEEALNRVQALQEQLSVLSTENGKLLGDIELLKTKVSALESK